MTAALSISALVLGTASFLLGANLDRIQRWLDKR
jgi:hypothetical protein